MGLLEAFTMVSPVGNQSQLQPIQAQPAAAKPAPTAASAAPAHPQAAPTDTVRLSSAAKLAQEAAETPAQTAKEAAGGDVQAKRLLAKESANRIK
jgi:pyruvate/2-oxoglutarate dehydrogenase complex dihydrolipoamide acyltransferase (E2) component